MTIKLTELMALERILLEINLKFKFELDFNDSYKLCEYLTKVGKITNHFFLIQDEFHQKYNDSEKLKYYHDKLMNDSVELDYDDIVKFIDKILNMHKDHETETLVENIKFWK